MKHFILHIAFCLVACIGLAQNNISVEYSASTIGLNETFSISIKSKNDKITSWGDFPEIDGFKKLNISSGSQQQITMDQNGVQRITFYTISQIYKPTKKGEFTVNDFELEINKKKYKIKGRLVKVTEARRRRSLFDDFFNEPSYDFDFKEVDDNAFLSVTPTQRSIYVGQSVGLSLDFYMARSNYGIVEFKSELGQQLADIGQELKLPDCWIESFEITKLEYTQENINDKLYLKYHLGDFLLFPNAEHDLKVPAVTLDMVKYKISEQADRFGRRHKQAGSKKYRSKALRIKVKPLPPHPLKDIVSVGRYQLKEKVNKKEVETGGAVEYEFKIEGMGNINMIEAPTITKNDSLIFFKPIINQSIKKENGKLYGTKEFSYSIVTERPGSYDFSNYLEWIYFDPERKKYDTLKPRLIVKAKGRKLSEIDMEDDNLSDFYDRLETADKKWVFLKDPDYTQLIVNVLSCILLTALGFTYYKKRNG